MTAVMTPRVSSNVSGIGGGGINELTSSKQDGRGEFPYHHGSAEPQ